MSSGSHVRGDEGSNAIEVQGLTRRYGGVLALDRVDLAVGEGELFSVLGPSGCGKTTLLRLLAGFERPDAGAIFLGGRDVADVPPWRRNVNTVFQQLALFPHLDVFENVAFGPRARGVPEAEVGRRVAGTLEVVRLQGLERRRPDELSGGQRQRVALARALANRPAALLLDEPLSALDLQLRRAMQAELRRIQRESGIAFVMVTHDQEEALGLSDRIAVMSEGRVEQVGTPGEVYDAPTSARVAAFIGSANLLDGVVEGSSDGTLHVRAGTSAVAIAGATTRHRAGERVVVLVRPERIRVAAAGMDRAEDGEHGGPIGASIAGTIVEVVFHGAFARCTVRTAEGLGIVAQPRAGATALPVVGQQVVLSWPASAARVLAERGTGAPSP